MKHLLRALSILVFIILQSTFCNFIGIMGVIPNLVLAYIIALALTSESILYAGAYGLAGGLLLDLMWGRVFGIRSLLFMYTAILVFRAGEYIYRKSLFVCVIFTLIAAACVESVFYTVGFVLGYGAAFWNNFFRIIVPSAAYTAVFQILIYQMCVKIAGVGDGRSGV